MQVWLISLIITDKTNLAFIYKVITYLWLNNDKNGTLNFPFDCDYILLILSLISKLNKISVMCSFHVLWKSDFTFEKSLFPLDITMRSGKFSAISGNKGVIALSNCSPPMWDGKCQFSFQSQRKAMTNSAQCTIQLSSFHMLSR